jgi:hypothetical protein
VLTKGQFAQRLPKLLEEALAAPAPGT